MPRILNVTRVRFCTYHYLFLAPYLFAQPYQISPHQLYQQGYPTRESPWNLPQHQKKRKQHDFERELKTSRTASQPRSNVSIPMPLCQQATTTYRHSITSHTVAYQHTRICNPSQHPRLNIPNGWYSCKPSDPAPSPRPQLREPTAQSPSN